MSLTKEEKAIARKATYFGRAWGIQERGKKPVL
jgi:hypothetical protein